jgi:subtilisin family serine protease
MDRKKIMLYSMAGLILMALVAASMPEPFGSDYASGKIDQKLAENKAGEKDTAIPVIVILKADRSPDLAGFNVKYNYRLIHGLAGEATSSAIEKIAANDGVQKIFYDSFAHLDYSDSGSNGSDDMIPAQAINADQLWSKGIDGRGVIVAILDSGIDENHPDLAGKIIGEKNFVADEATADDLLGHGTMVAGIIAGSGAASDGKYMGIAPGASLLNVKVINSKGDGRISDIIAGIEWALYNGADVLSLSLGGINLGETNPPITMAADNAMDQGAVVFVAAGNRNNTKVGKTTRESVAQIGDFKTSVQVSQIEDDKKKDVMFLLVPIVLALPPGLIDSPGDGVKVITLGASDYGGLIANFSGSGPTRDDRTKPDVVAPGVNIISTVPPGMEKPDYIDAYYARESGTSLSTPVAAGLAALLLQENSNMTPAGIKATMAKGAEKLYNTLGQEYEEYYQGTGLLNSTRSLEMSSPDICAAVPDRWIAGRWAYLPAGKGLYVGLDAGADRPQKKLYALAPGDEDWTNRFVFISNSERENIKASVSGSISDWISLQALPSHMDANSQKVFAGSLIVPAGTLPGIYSGNIDIDEGGKRILSIPVSAEVAEHFGIKGGRGAEKGTLNKSEWNYYYLDVFAGTTELKASLAWDSNSSLDLFLLAPTSEYFTGEKTGRKENVKIENPPSGRWLMAVHSENLFEPVNYSLEVERALIETIPRRWSVSGAAPGSSVKTEFQLENKGHELDDLKYAGFIENISMGDFSGSVGYKEVWEKAFNVTENTNRISARLSRDDNDNQSEILLVFENPKGNPEDAALGSGDLGPLEISKPEIGQWKIKVYGYNVPEDGASFQAKLAVHAQESWDWIRTLGPASIGSDSNATIEANLTIPRYAPLPKLDGFIEIRSANQTFQIPVTVTVAGTTLSGLKSTNVEDLNDDGFLDGLILELGLNVTAPGDYYLQGLLTDCAGNKIQMISETTTAKDTGFFNININGSEIWKSGKCGPIRIRNLVLFNQRGELVDRYDEDITLKLDPKEFQPPAAYLLEEYANRTNSSKIMIGVNLSAVKAGHYRLSGTIVDDNAEELGTSTVEEKLGAGNATLVLAYNPDKFVKLNRSSRIHLTDLVLDIDGSILERKDNAWTSGQMSPLGFELRTEAENASLRASGIGRNNVTIGTMRRENGRVVIS